MSQGMPFSHRFDLSGVSAAGSVERIEVPAGPRDAIAKWCEVDGVDELSAVMEISRSGRDSYVLQGRLDAQIRQTCIVTLSPLRSQIRREFVRRYRLGEKQGGRRGGVAVLRVEDTDDEIEVIFGKDIDLAGPLLEELSLAIDPYPRSEGAAFDPGEAGTDPSHSPFGVLEKLKKKAPPPEKT